MKTKCITMLLIAVFSLVSVRAQECTGNYLNAVGNKLFDSYGNEVQITGVNWFGFETSMNHFHGLWTRDHKSMLQQIKDQGFNTIRIPWCNEILRNTIQPLQATGTDSYTGVSPMNLEESQVTTPLELLDITVRWCQENDMKIILDNHSRNPDGYMVEKLWYTENVSHEQWIADWVTMAERYKDNDAVIGMDINNEPHGNYGEGSRWGTGNIANDWRLAAQECGNAILEVNPNVLIFVEGIEEFENTGYWWGGNLVGAKKYPVVLSNPQKLVYSPHEYGPTVHPQDWFFEEDFPENMEAIWEKHFHYLHREETSPLMVGEFGIAHLGGLDEIWFRKFMQFMGEHGYSWTFWCWNPNSGDTGGILYADWSTIVEWKMDILRPYLAPPIANCGGKIIEIPATSISISDEQLMLEEEQVYTLSADVLPEKASNKNVIWESSNINVVTVSETGFVSAVGIGIAEITATSEDGGFIASCSVQVNEAGSGTGQGCALGAPQQNALSTINGGYNYTHIIGEGPSLDNVTRFSINWNLQNNACYQLSFNTNDGRPNWWIDLRRYANIQFGKTMPEISFSNTGIPGFDGDYWVAEDNGNIVMREKDRGFYIYFSNSATEPCAKSAKQSITSKFEIYPNPANGLVYLNNIKVSDIVNIYSLTGALQQSVKGVQMLDVSELNTGTYIIQLITTGGDMQTRRLIIK